MNVAQASRFVSNTELKKVREGLADGSVDIVVGTHALLAKTIAFKDLGLIIIDEEQHFGVSHKERLKALKAEVHVLTLSATPIPRTLQLAMTGVRELSIIATPPVDRLAVRTFVMPFDPLSIREALLRERYRGGQAFYVVPRIEHLEEVKRFLDREVPEAKVAVAHGQMAAGQLEDVMTAFYEGQYDILLATTIVESGLDIPTANTLIVHRADMFGLAQLYQLRGRVGRSKARAYALFTTPEGKPLTVQAERRLSVLQSLDTLGAGFQLASHDLDIRGAGNLLGDEQSGHVKEVGYELYQQMLESAVAALKSGNALPTDEQWSPTIALGAPVTMPEHYVADLSVRLGLYRRLATLENDRELESFGAELIDRFGADAAGGGRASQDRDDQDPVPRDQRREGRGRPEGHRHALPRPVLRQPGQARRLHRRPALLRQGAPGHERGVHPRSRHGGGAAEGDDGDFAGPGEADHAQEGGVRLRGRPFPADPGRGQRSKIEEMLGEDFGRDVRDEEDLIARATIGLDDEDASATGR